MVEKSYSLLRKFNRYIGLGALALMQINFGCSTLKVAESPKLFNGTNISEKSTQILNSEQESLNANQVYLDRPEMYENNFQVDTIGDIGIIKYHTRNLDPLVLKGVLEEQLEGYVEKISVVPETNQVVMRIGKNSGLEEKIREIITGIDIAPPQVMIDMRIIRVFADYTKDISSYLKVQPRAGEDGIYPSLLSDIPGAKLRVPERVAENGLGVQYGIIGELGRYELIAKLDQLQSQGVVHDLAHPTLTVSNGKKATIELKQELPYKDEVFQGGALLALTKYKDVINALTVTPKVRDNKIISLNLDASTGSFNPTGVLQVPGITQRKVTIEEVQLREGETLVVGGFQIDHELGVERKDTWMSKIPGISYLFPKGQDEEMSNNQIYFIATPIRIDVNQGNVEEDKSDLKKKVRFVYPESELEQRLFDGDY